MSCKGGGYKRSFRKHFESNNKHKPHLVMWHLRLEKSIWPSPKCPRPVNIHTRWKVTEAIMIPGVISVMYRIISIKTPNRVNHTESSDSNTLHKGKCWQHHMLWLEGDSQVWISNKWGQPSQLGIKYMDACGSHSAVGVLWWHALYSLADGLPVALQWCTYSKETEVLMIFFFLALRHINQVYSILSFCMTQENP